MNNIMKTILAKQVIEVSATSITFSDYILHELKSGKIIESESFTGLQVMKEIIEGGLPLILPVEYKNKIATLMEHVLSNVNSDEVIDYFISKLTKEDVSNLTQEMIRDIYEASSHSNSLLDKFFNLDFNFKQGEFNELDRAMSGDIEFFELCIQAKTDFKFTFKYDEGLTLDQYLAEDIEACKKSTYKDPVIKERESLHLFLKKAREIEELKDNLDKNLNNKISASSLMKKI